jgi:hypothetical protein
VASIPPSGFGRPPVYGRAANAAEKVQKKNTEQSNKNSEEHVRMEQHHERNSYVINHLAETVSGEAMIKELEQKRKRYLERIEEVMRKNESEIKKRNIDQETLLRDLEIIAQSLLERNEKLDEFFKFKVNIEEDSKTQEDESETDEEKSDTTP